MPTEWLKTIAHGGKSSRAIVGGCVRYCPLDPRLKTRVCARTMHQRTVGWAIASAPSVAYGLDFWGFLDHMLNTGTPCTVQGVGRNGVHLLEPDSLTTLAPGTARTAGRITGSGQHSTDYLLMRQT